MFVHPSAKNRASHHHNPHHSSATASPVYPISKSSCSNLQKAEIMRTTKMGLNKRHQEEEEEEEDEEEASFCSFLKHSFHTLSIATNSLLFPLSLLSLARFEFFTTTTSSLLTPVFLHAGLPVICALCTLISLAALFHSLAGRLLRPPSVAIAWAFLCLFHVSLAAGTDAILSAAGATRSTTSTVYVGDRVALIKRAVVFVGLYRTMRVWTKTVVKRVADDTIFGEEVKEDFSHKVVVSVAFATVWVLMLRDAEHMVLATVERGLTKEMGLGGWVRWLVSHAIVMTGIIRSVRALLRAGKFLFCRVREDEDHSIFYCAAATADHKVLLI